MEIKTDAIVLRAADYKDADKILTLLTPSAGKLTAGIKGVKKSGAKLAFSAQPFAFCEYVLAQKGGRYTVTSAYLHDGFFPLRTNITRYYAACAAMEIADELSAEGAENESLFVAAAQALRSLAYAEETESPAEIVSAFLLTALFEAGYMIDLDGCGACGREIEENSVCYFDFPGGRFLCGSCGAAAGGANENLVRENLRFFAENQRYFMRKCPKNRRFFPEFRRKNPENRRKNGQNRRKNAENRRKTKRKRRGIARFAITQNLSLKQNRAGL